MRVKLPKLRLKSLISSRNIGTSLLLGVFVLLVATYGAYQLQKLLSPISNRDNATVKIELRASDRTGQLGTSTPLQNAINGNGVPEYNYDPTVPSQGPTVLPNNTTFRIQGEVYYKDK